jgi:uncharacterized protein (TIGR02996 family)
MNDAEAGFVATIQAEPDDNTHRLVYADWLDEYGTSDRHRARSEWIRMTCWDRGKRAQRPTGWQVRMAGEPAWLKKNAERLWPNLMKLESTSFGRSTEIRLQTGQILFRIPIELPDTRYENAVRLDSTVVVLEAERGVATRAWVSFLRASISAPFVALDEPHVPIRFNETPDGCFEFGHGQLAIHRREFTLRGMTGVWELLDLPRGAIGADLVKIMANPTSLYTGKPAEPLIDAALTKWARDLEWPRGAATDQPL